MHNSRRSLLPCK
uniref:Uncharacterized protein n=1 Tax=Arundo donax TaxID=35708 RepID=A0A0A9AAH1_ARUDO